MVNHSLYHFTLLKYGVLIMNRTTITPITNDLINHSVHFGNSSTDSEFGK